MPATAVNLEVSLYFKAELSKHFTSKLQQFFFSNFPKGRSASAAVTLTVFIVLVS